MYILKGTFLSQIELHSVSLMSTHEKLLELQKADREWVKITYHMQNQSLYLFDTNRSSVLILLYKQCFHYLNYTVSTLFTFAEADLGLPQHSKWKKHLYLHFLRLTPKYFH